MPQNYWRLVNKVIQGSDIILLILDARMPELTRHYEIEAKIKREKKKIIYVLNKSDLVTRESIINMKKEISPCVFVSSKKQQGGTLLFKKIMQITHGESPFVGVLGYPNVGKSSVINMLKGSKSASVSPHAGHTTGIQYVRAKSKLKLLDTPGVLPFGENDILKEVIIGSRNPEQLKEPDFFALKLIELYPAFFEKFYNIKYENDAYDFLDKAARDAHVLVKGGEPDFKRFSRKLLYDWQRGQVHEAFIKK
jgi:ribosome biogenesis GTPase A